MFGRFGAQPSGTRIEFGIQKVILHLYWRLSTGVLEAGICSGNKESPHCISLTHFHCLVQQASCLAALASQNLQQNDFKISRKKSRSHLCHCHPLRLTTGKVVEQGLENIRSLGIERLQEALAGFP